MSVRAMRVASRIVFVVCGLVSLLIAVPYAMLQGADLPVESEWIVFFIALVLVGALSLAAGLLPRRWIAKASRLEPDDPRLFSFPLRLVGIFASIFYLIALVAYLAPHSWNLNPQLMFSLCPMYFVKMTFDPSRVAVFFLLAPMNAAVYGALGLTLGYFWLASRRRSAQQG